EDGDVEWKSAFVETLSSSLEFAEGNIYVKERISESIKFYILEQDVKNIDRIIGISILTV
ncbi:1625_t:CDS:2, partial [Gigaspora rosea]